jgi:hypothetical protein
MRDDGERLPATSDDACYRTMDWLLEIRGPDGEADLRPGCKGGNHYIIGERLRSGSPEAAAALSRQGRYQEVAENLRVKEVRIAEDERFVICCTPRAERDAAVRARMTAQLKELIDGTDGPRQGQAARTARRHLDEAGPEPLPAGHSYTSKANSSRSSP